MGTKAAAEGPARSGGPPHYYVPHGSWWPILGSVGLGLLAVGTARLLAGDRVATEPMTAGATLILVMLFGWFGTVVAEGLAGRFDARSDRSFRLGMAWFIFSEVMFFAAFFGALFYARTLSVPWLGGAGAGVATHQVLWPQFQATWPLLRPPEPGRYDLAKRGMEAAGIPALNTFILLLSSVTVTWAHWGLKRGQRRRLILGLVATLALGISFLTLQAHEYLHAWLDLDLRLGSGIYGSTFYLLTGFHGLHVTIGAVMLAAMLARALAGHFTPGHHFAFEAASWYWHFVDLVWLCLFTFVYWL